MIICNDSLGCRDCLQAALTTRMLTRVVFTTIVILLTAVTGVMPSEDNSTLCYSCTYSYNPGADDACVTDPANVLTANTVVCPHDGRVCSIFRQWDIAEQVIRSLQRGCMADAITGCVPDFYFESCYYYCDKDLCNDMDVTPTTTVKATTVTSTTTAMATTTTRANDVSKGANHSASLSTALTLLMTLLILS